MGVILGDLPYDQKVCIVFLVMLTSRRVRGPKTGSSTQKHVEP